MFMHAQGRNLEAKSRLRLISFNVIKAEVLTCFGALTKVCYWSDKNHERSLLYPWSLWHGSLINQQVKNV